MAKIVYIIMGAESGLAEGVQNTFDAATYTADECAKDDKSPKIVRAASVDDSVLYDTER